MSAQRTLLVTGASGHLGRRTLELLVSRAGNDRIVAATRSPDKIADLKTKGIELRTLDFDQPSTLSSALAGVDKMLLVSTDALDRPGRRLEQHLVAIEAAKRAGVKHIVYTSMPRPSDANPMLLAFDHRGTEHALRQSGLVHTVLRNNWYMENLLGALPHILASGTISDASGQGRVGWVSREDCARAAAAALASREDKSSVRDITGPELLGLVDVARVLSEFCGRVIRATPVDVATRKGHMVAAGLPEGIAAVLANSEEGMAQGWLAVISDDVRILTGEDPISFRHFLELNSKAITSR